MSLFRTISTASAMWFVMQGAAWAASPALAGKELCAAITDKYAQATASSAPAMTNELLGTLTSTPASGVTEAKPALEQVTPDNLAQWAKDNSIAIPDQMLDAVRNNTDMAQTLDRLPGTNFYAINGTAGTASCYQPGVYFNAMDGKAAAAEPPAGWREDGAGCMVIRSFGDVDGTPAAFETGQAEDGAYSLTASPWTGKGFGPSCTARFKFDAKGALTNLDVN